MSDKNPKGFRFSDIVKKLNESEPKPAGPARPSRAPAAPPLPAPPADAGEAPDGRLPAQPAFGRQDPAEAGAPSAVPPTPPPPRAPEPRPAPAAAATPTPPSATPPPTAAPPLSGGEKSDEEEEETFDIYRYLNVLLRRKFIIAAATVVVGLLSLHTYLTSGKHYIAHARLLFSPGHQEIVTDEYSAWSMYNDREQKLNTHMELLKSDQEVLQRVTQSLDNKVNPGAVAGGLQIARGQTGGRENDIIEVKYTHSEPDIARDVVNQVCIQYVDYIRDVQAQDITQMITKFEDQIRKVELELKEKEDNLRLFKEKNQFVELSSEASALVAKSSEMEAALQQTELDLQENRERLTSMQNQIGRQEVDVINSVTYQDLYKNRLSELQFELNTLAAEYSRDHYKVKMVEKEIEKIKEAIRTQATTKTVQTETFVKNPVRESLVQSLVSLTIDKASLEAKRAAQEQIIAKQRTELMQLPLLEQKYASLQRETESLIQTLQMLKSQYEKAKIKRDSQETDLKILQLSATPSAGVRGVKINRVYMGLLIGLIIGIALAFLFEYLDQTIKDPRELERGLDLPLLGIVPQIEGDKAVIDFSSSKGRTRLEPFRVLRTNLKHLADVHHLKTLIICSAVKGEGKTTLAVNMAISFAMDGKKVILVDGDLRRPQIHGILGIAKEIGFSDYITGAVSDVRHILKPTMHENLRVITSGERPHHPTELLGTVRFPQMVEELKVLADFVIFDSPALLPVSDTIAMAPKMDGCVVVARTLWTPLKAARQAKLQLERIGSKMLGSILNGISHSRGYYPYYYGYYRYYAYKYTYEYEEDPRRKSSIRSVGLKIEAGLRDLLQNAQHVAPRFTVELVKELRRIATRKRFWLLVGIFLLTALITPWIRDRRQTFLPSKIHYLGGTAVTGEEAGRSSTETPAPAGRPIESIRSEPSTSSAPNDIMDTVRTPQPTAGPGAEAQAWLESLRRGAWQECRSWYDSAGFRFPGGGFAEYESAIRQGPPSDSIAVRGHTVDRVSDSLYRSVAGVTQWRAGDTARSSIAQMWGRRHGRWLIVAEKRDTVP